MIGGPAVIARFQGGTRSLPRMRSSRLGLPTRSRATRSPVIMASMGTGYGNAPWKPAMEMHHGNRLWKCRRYGNHRTVSTAPWKSSKEREIPTFPQPLPVFHDKTTKKKTTNGMRLHLDNRRSVRAR